MKFARAKEIRGVEDVVSGPKENKERERVKI